MATFDNQKMKQGFVLSILVVLGVFLFLKMFSFVSAFLGAVVFYIMLRPLFYYLHDRKKWNKALTASVLMLLSFLVLLLPVFTVIYMMKDKVYYLFDHSNEIIAGLRSLSDSVHKTLGFDIFSEQSLKRAQDYGEALIPSLLSNVLSVTGDIIFMYFMLYFMLTNSRQMEATIFDYLPFNFEDNDKLAEELRSMTISNAIGIPVIGLVQALVAMLGYWIFGVQEPVFWGIMTGFLSVVPVLGTLTVWLPLGLYLWSTGQHWQGLCLLGYGPLIIMNTDHVLRFVLLKKFSNVHPLITIFGILIGVDLFGFVGLIFGPLLLAYFLLLIKIYRNEYVRH